jgi:hypothetical protein
VIKERSLLAAQRIPLLIRHFVKKFSAKIGREVEKMLLDPTS